MKFVKLVKSSNPFKKTLMVEHLNKIKAAEQPTTPKPTTTLPDNMTWAWDPKANQWIAVMKDNPVVTPPTYNPNNITNTSNYTTTNYVSNIKSGINKQKALEIGAITQEDLDYLEKINFTKNHDEKAQKILNKYTKIMNENNKKEVKSSADSYNIIMKAKKISDEFYGNDDSKINYMLILKLNEDETDIIDTKIIKKKEALTYPINPHEYFLYMDRDTGWNEIDYSMHPTSELKRYYGNEEQVKEWYKEFTKQSTLIDSLNQFLDGDRYSREIKIEKGLISGGLIKLAGINPIRGPKYSITDKGLNLLKQAAQEEYDFEKDYIKARKSYLLDGISESEFKTGAPESQGKMPKFSIFEKDGSELAQVEANNETDAKVKFIMENPEYEGSQSISVKKIDSTYSETTNEALSYPNQSVSPSTDVKVNPHGWVNMAADENIDKKQTILKNLVYQHNKQNGEESAIGLSLDFDNKAVATGDLKSLSKLENQLRDEEIHCNITPRKDFPEMYELTVFYNTKGAPTDKFAALKKKAAENPIVFSERPEAIKFEIDENYLFKIINQHPKLQGIKLDLAQRDQTYTLEYKLSSEVKWDMWFDMRSWGIKEMRPGVMDQTISIDIDYSGEDEAPIKNGMYFSIEVPIKNIKCEIESRESGSNQFFLKELEIKDDSGKAIF